MRQLHNNNNIIIQEDKHLSPSVVSRGSDYTKVGIEYLLGNAKLKSPQSRTPVAVLSQPLARQVLQTPRYQRIVQGIQFFLPRESHTQLS